MTREETYMQRCFDLARRGAGQVSPNPMVGAVLVYQDRIIGEGFHQKYGEAHAEVNAVRSLAPADQHLLSKSELYVSLEPCCIFGRTPPCTNLVIINRIPRVIISCLDQTPGVAGQGVETLRANGVEVITGVLEAQGQDLARVRNHYVTQERPYVILKFAQSVNGYLGAPNRRVWLSNDYARRLAHKWRSEVDAILVGTNTALVDNPQLTNRLYFGKSPLRIVLDRQLRLPASLHLFDQSQPTLLVTEQPAEQVQHSVTEALTLNFAAEDFLIQLLRHLHQHQITTLLVEGGALLLQSFIEKNCWDEAWVITTGQALEQGIPAPRISGFLSAQYPLGNNQILRYHNVSIR